MPSGWLWVTAALVEKCFFIGHFSVDSPAEPPEWDTDEDTTLFVQIYL
jgi:hypothetical protein